RKSQLELLGIEAVARHVHSNKPTDNHSSSVTRKLSRQLDRFAGFGGRGYQDAIGASAFSKILASCPRRCPVRRYCVRARSLCKLASRGVDVNAKHAAPRSLKQLNGELPNQSQPYDRDGLAEARIGLTHSLKGYCADGRVRRSFQRNLIGDFATE